MGSRVYQYVPGGALRFVRFRPRIKISDDELEALRMRHPGSTGHPRGQPRHGSFVGGLETIAKKLGCSGRTVSRHLQRIAKREEG